MRAKTLIALGLVMLVVAAAPAVGAGTGSWTGPLYEIKNNTVDFEELIQGSKASYTNGADSIAYSINAKQLEKDHGYTIWLMVFNDPENCIDGGSSPVGLQCGLRDHLNPAAEFSVMYGTGAWANGSSVRFEGVRQGNSPLDVPSDVLLGPGLVNPAGAEVHFRVRDHGKPEDCPECSEDEQITTFAGGCDDETAFIGPGTHGDYLCADVQATGS